MVYQQSSLNHFRFGISAVTMFYLILLGILLICDVKCNDSDSTEAAKVEVSPIYDTIIFSDIAEILNELDNNVNTAPEVPVNSVSESEEDVEDLLSEYQRYLERAHKQRRSYLERSKLKNKVPLLRYENFIKKKPTSTKYEDFSGSFYSPSALLQSSISNPIELFIPTYQNSRYPSNGNINVSQPKANRVDLPILKTLASADKTLTLPPSIHRAAYGAVKSSCMCKNDKIPCECPCKQCLMTTSTKHGRNTHSDRDKYYRQNPFYSDYMNIANSQHDYQDNTLNIRVKVDIQLPKIQDILRDVIKESPRNLTDENTIQDDKNITKDAHSDLASGVAVPFPYFNFHIPMDLFGFKKTSLFSQHESPMHKIIAHKKKKTRQSNSSKKHRKKVITFHNIKLDAQASTPNINDENYNSSDYDMSFKNTLNLTQLQNNASNKTDETLHSNETQAEENMFLNVNISNPNIDNVTEEQHKNENSIETEISKGNVTTSQPKSFRKKRELLKTYTGQPNTTVVVKIAATAVTNRIVNQTESTTLPNKNISHPDKVNIKKTDKELLSDLELLYWPGNAKVDGKASSKNITAIILEREHKKSKLNISRETMRHNRTKALEQAIFGEVDWTDIDTVAPIFMSFVGKYVNGILTFCSENICHSMKCFEKTCVHRTCLPNERYNQRGHCVGSNNTDSVASMESILDLPSNVAFDIVDILQDKMLGMLFGKVTLCISAKCISFVTSKKNFLKSKCSTKELNITGHCPNVKTIKT